VEEQSMSHEVTKVPGKLYRQELRRLQTELVKLQRWVQATGGRVVVVFEGRDAAGKGGTIRRITKFLGPRATRVVALPSPTERERGQWYFQRYIAHLPTAGEIVVFDRSWYNRAGVEHVMGFCTEDEYQRFLTECPMFERTLVEDGIWLIKYWLSVSEEEQERRFRSRLEDPLRQWKLSVIDLESRLRWSDYSRARDVMFAHTNTPEAPWHIVAADDKRRARLNCIAHLLSLLPYEDLAEAPPELPPRPTESDYQRPPRDRSRYVPDHTATLLTSTSTNNAQA
jgi:polyphosphate kinase 2